MSFPISVKITTVAANPTYSCFHEYFFRNAARPGAFESNEERPVLRPDPDPFPPGLPVVFDGVQSQAMMKAPASFRTATSRAFCKSSNVSAFVFSDLSVIPKR